MYIYRYRFIYIDILKAYRITLNFKHSYLNGHCISKVKGFSFNYKITLFLRKKVMYIHWFYLETLGHFKIETLCHASHSKIKAMKDLKRHF